MIDVSTVYIANWISVAANGYIYALYIFVSV